MNPETVEKLSQELQQPEGFSSYKEVHQWLTSCCEVKVAYRKNSGQDIGSKANLKCRAR
jgi:hypothetical protein